MSSPDPPDPRVTLLDVMIGVSECAVLFALASRSRSVLVATAVGLMVVVPAWWMSVEFANRTDRWSFRRRLPAHLLGLAFGCLCLTCCGMPLVAVAISEQFERYRKDRG